jgi:hypothetical protein
LLNRGEFLHQPAIWQIALHRIISADLLTKAGRSPKEDDPRPGKAQPFRTADGAAEGDAMAMVFGSRSALTK